MEAIKTATPSIGAQIDALHATREKMRELNSELKIHQAKKAELEAGLLASLEAQGIEQSRGTTATVTVTRAIVPNVLDWEAFYAYIKANDAFYLLDRRASAPSYRELLEARDGKAVPGVEPFERTTISLRTRS